MFLMSQRESIVAPPAGYSTQIARLAEMEASLGLAIRGKPDVVRLSLVCLLARGHLLIGRRRFLGGCVVRLQDRHERTGLNLPN